MPWKPRQLTSAELDLQRENHALQMALLKLRSELSTKQTYAGRLEYLLHERLEKIDALNGTIDQLRAANQRLTAMLVAPAPTALNGMTAEPAQAPSQA